MRLECGEMRTMTLVLVAAQAVAPGLVTFSTIAKGPMGQIVQPQEVVVRTAAAWGQLWQANGPQNPRPAVDFDQSLVVGVFLGARPTAGYSVEIVRVRRLGRTAIVVDYVEHRPAAGRFLAQVITSPFHLVTLSANVESVEFKRLDQPV